MPKPGDGMPPDVKKIVGNAPSTQAVLESVVERLELKTRSKPAIAASFDTILQSMMDEGIRILEEHQIKVADRLVEEYLKLKAGDRKLAFQTIHKGFVSFGNSRKKRAGVHMERYVRFLLEHCGIPHELGNAVSGQSDVVVPRVDLLNTHPELCVVLEFKRTIRERWKQARDEVLRNGIKVWLLTLDDYLSDPLLELMADANITLYVPESVYQKFHANHPKLRRMRRLIDDLSAIAKISQQAA